MPEPNVLSSVLHFPSSYDIWLPSQKLYSLIDPHGGRSCSCKLQELEEGEETLHLFSLLLHTYTHTLPKVGPRWDCLPPTLTITIKELPPEKTRFSGVKQHSVYDVETKELSSCVTRKYKHFLWLYDRLAEGFPCVSLPPLPVKQFSGEMMMKVW